MKKSILFQIALISILLNCCSPPHYYYSSNSQNVPLFNEGNKFSGSTAASVGIVNPSFEFQGGYSFLHHMALTAAFMGGGNDNSKSSVTDNSKMRYLEGALGYYNKFSRTGVFELYGGMGRGSQHHVFAYWDLNQGWTPDGRADLSFSKIFIQPDIGMKFKYMEGALSFRLTRLNFDPVNVYNTSHRINEFNALKQYNIPWLLEPALTLRAGSESVKGHIQLVLSNHLTKPELQFEGMRFNIGMIFNFSTKKQTKDLPAQF